MPHSSGSDSSGLTTTQMSRARRIANSDNESKTSSSHADEAMDVVSQMDSNYTLQSRGGRDFYKQIGRRGIPPPRPPRNILESLDEDGLTSEIDSELILRKRCDTLDMGKPPKSLIPYFSDRVSSIPDRVETVPNAWKDGTLSKANTIESSSVTSESRNWDVFRLLPPPSDNLKRSLWMDVSLQMLKIGTIVVVLFLVGFSAFVAKTTFLLMTSAISWGGKNVTVCHIELESMGIAAAKNMTIGIENRHVVKWIWSAFMTICFPEICVFLKCAYNVCFRHVKTPTVAQFFVVFTTESLYAVGVGLLVFRLLPNLDAVTGAMLTSCLSFVPAILTLLSRKPQKITVILIVFDIMAIGAQSSGFWAWPMFFPELAKEALTVPISLSLISLGFWPNFVSTDSVFPFIRGLARLGSTLHEKRSKTYALVAPWKCCVYAMTLLVLSTSRFSFNEIMAPQPFGRMPIKVYAWGNYRGTGEAWMIGGGTSTEGPKMEWNPNAVNQNQNWAQPITHPPGHTAATHSWMKPENVANEEADYEVDKSNALPDGILGSIGDIIPLRMKRAFSFSDFDDDDVRSRQKRQQPQQTRSPIASGRGYSVYELETNSFDSIWLVVLHCISLLTCYQTGKFACKVMAQRIAFSAPLSLMVPITIFALTRFCNLRAYNPCFFSSGMNLELFWRCSAHTSSYSNIIMSTQFWIWFTWFLSQFWVTIHLWRPRAARLATSDRLFVMPWFSAAFIDQSMVLNRRRDDMCEVKTEDIEVEAADSFYDILGNVMRKKPAQSVMTSASGRSGAEIIRANEKADSIVKIYACATMWHESAKEMTCMLKSIFRLDEDQCARRNAQKYLKIVDPDYYEFEAAIFVDDAYDINNYGEPIVNKFVQQIVEKMDVAASGVHQTQMRLKPPTKMATPYGGRLIYTLPGHNRLTIHLKDKTRIRHRKRWSQVMYMYYLLGFRIMQKVDDDDRKEVISENTFILTLDGDVDFKPHGVHLLLDLMKKNRRLGAACGRIHPRGSGIMVWYQKFEYAIGHWFQKATEHMIGCVMCAPGCFSLFRACALMDDNVAKRYAAKSENPRDYIQYDQGEDRWLCTLLLQRGYRVEYCAASDALTYAPERRRWIPSTMANTIDLVSDYRNVVRVNDNISIWYIMYQSVMLLSALLGPGTIFLMTIGAVSISFDLNIYASLATVFVPVATFGAMCCFCSPNVQLAAAKLIGAVFTLLMTAVFVGTALQIKKDGIYSPHAIFLFAVIGSFVFAAFMHPMESKCIVPMLLYFILIPCMYMILPIYSICNLNVVSWGTRENTSIDDPSMATGIHKKSKGRGGNGDAEDVDGNINIGCGTACRFMCCLMPSALSSSPALHKLTHAMTEIDRKLERLDRRIMGDAGGVSLEGGASHRRDWEERGLLNANADDDDDEGEHSDGENVIQNSAKPASVSTTWLNHRLFKRAKEVCIEADEEHFWRDVIDRYLHPLRLDKKETERISAGLADLRNKSTFVFFMMNGLFIMIVFLLQMKKDCLHIEWPLGPKVNRSFIPCDSMFTDETWEMTGLQLEPIGLVFLIFFMSILLIQFAAMMFHRLGTLAHIIASTRLFCFRSKNVRINEDDLVVANAVEIARELQAIKGVDISQSLDEDEDHISRRRVVQDLASSRRNASRHRTETLDAAFKKRFFALRAEGHTDDSGASTPVLGGGRKLIDRYGTVKALQKRRDSFIEQGTLDKATKSPYESDVQETRFDQTEMRAPAQRRLQQMFQHGQQSGGQVGIQTAQPTSVLNIPHPGSHQRAAGGRRPRADHDHGELLQHTSSQESSNDGTLDRKF